MTHALIAYFFAALALYLRLKTAHRLWSMPFKHGEDHFFAQKVGEAFYAGPGVAVLKSYRTFLLACLLIDLPLALWILFSDWYTALVVEQFIAWILTAIAYNLAIVHYNWRAAALAGPRQTPAPAGVLLSMQPRRLRDYTHPALEALTLVALLSALVLVVKAHIGPTLPWVRLPVVDALTAWLVYLQLGLLLLKVVFVRWRMPLPVQRTEDFRRWRMAWLEYHLHLYDGARLIFALALLTAVLWLTDWWQQITLNLALSAWVVGIALATVYFQRENRRLMAVTQEIKPVELVREFPARGVAEGRFMAAELLFFNPDNPSVLVRSHRGMALNLANSTTYIWAAYLAGLVLLALFISR